MWILNTLLCVSVFSPCNVVKHWHEDDSACAVLWFTLYFSHHLLNLIEDSHCGESWENLPREFHRLSINSIQFAETIVVRTPLNLLLPGFHRILPHFSQTEHRVGEDVDFGSGILISSAVQQACRYPPQILEIDHSYASSFCLTNDQLFSVPLFSKDNSFTNLKIMS